MFSRRHLLESAAATTAALSLSPAWAATSRAQVLDTMRRATAFMTDKVAVHGGYVWSYLPDFSRRWGEMEAKPSMIWLQEPGTPEMGETFLDAYHATGDETYYRAAESVAAALIACQHPAGGWNYIHDFAGQDSLKDWYATIGANGWRLEEFQHYYGNATFDDHTTAMPARFLLRIYLEKKSPIYKAALDKVIDFILKSQYPVGGWPQRYPFVGKFEKHGHPDYTGHITLNDEVAEQNIDFLLLVLQHLGDARVREPIQRAMDCYIKLQQPQPTPGFALQYTLDLKPAGARTYEPASISPHTTAAALEKLMDFTELTGDKKYLARVGEAIDWLAKVEAPKETHTRDGRNYFHHFEPQTERLIGVHRRGSNAQNGEYYADYDMTGTMAAKKINPVKLRQRLEKLTAADPAKLIAKSPLFGHGPSLLPRFVMTKVDQGSDLNMNSNAYGKVSTLIAGLNAEGYWPTELKTTSHPYRGPGPAAPPPGFVDNSRGQVGDAWDTSPFTLDHGPMGISTGTYMRNMGALIADLVHNK